MVVHVELMYVVRMDVIAAHIAAVSCYCLNQKRFKLQSTLDNAQKRTTQPPHQQQQQRPAAKVHALE